MDFASFWEQYSHAPAEDMYEQAMSVFQQKMPDDIAEEYDWTEVVLDIYGAQERLRNFEHAEALFTLLKEKQPELYRETLPYLLESLLPYFLHKRQHERLIGPLAEFGRQLHNFPDLDELIYLKVALTGNLDLVDALFSKEAYDQVVAAAQFDLAHDMASFRFHLDLERAYLKMKAEGNFPYKEYTAALDKFNLKYTDEQLSREVELLRSGRVDDAEDLFKKDKVKLFDELETVFYTYMHTKGLSFCASAIFWSLSRDMWEETTLKRAHTLKQLFHIRPSSLKHYLKYRRGLNSLDFLPEQTAILWGSAYVYDFLFEQKLIDEQIHQEISKLIQQEKANVLHENTSELWRVSYLENWPPVLGQTTEAHAEEVALIAKSFSEPYQPKESELLEMQKIIDAYEKDIEKRIAQKEDEIARLERRIQAVSKPAVGRNDPCPCGSGKKYKKCCGR